MRNTLQFSASCVAHGDAARVMRCFLRQSGTLAGGRFRVRVLSWKNSLESTGLIQRINRALVISRHDVTKRIKQDTIFLEEKETNFSIRYTEPILRDERL